MTSDSNGIYQYQPLVDDCSYQTPKVQGAWTIRLIELQPGYGSPLNCTLHHVPLGKAHGHYEALSYVWGDAARTQQIVINNEHMAITSNLASALRRLRYKKSSRRLWIDALSIDQHNLVEKNVQVHRMWAIYALARQVIIDLGEETWNSSAGMDMVERLARIGHDPQQVLNFFTVSSHHNFTVACKGLRDIFDRPWWSRVWVVQELAVATRAIVMCGEGTLPWTDFELVIEILTDLSFHPERFVDAYGADVRLLYLPSLHLASAWSLCTARRRFREDAEHSLASTMISFRSAQTTDPRDHLYGLLRLSSETQSITPDYTKSPDTVYMEIVRLSITSDVGLAIWSALDYGNSRLDLPSWCPDWSAPSPANFPFYTPQFCCTKTVDVQCLFTGRTLALRGVELDEIVSASEPSSARITLPLEEVYEAVNKLRSKNISQAEFTRQVALFIERTTSIFTRQRMFEQINALKDPKERKISQIYMTWLRRRTLEIASNPNSYTIGAQKLSDGSALGVVNNKGNMQIINVAYGRTIFLTKQGELGLAPSAARRGDIIAALWGGRTPFCLRPRSDEDNCQYEIIGDCYIEKWMYGTAIDLLADGKLTEKEFVLL